MGKIFSAPTSINLELTDVCNTTCRHCYNFWREENNRTTSLTKEKLDRLIDMFTDVGVFHVVLTGGEPFTRFDLLERGIKKLFDKNISISCNSNLMLATEDKLKRLKDIGMDHILTSLNSYDPSINDYMVNQKGAFKKIISGIELAVKHGIRISVNMIVYQINKDHVYQTGKLAYELGCQKIFGTRVVPPVGTYNPQEKDVRLSTEDSLHVLNQLVKVKEDTGIMIGTLVSYPLCLLSDLEKYRDFVGRGCPAQQGHRMSINANGEAHACVHEEKGYGNVFDIGIQKAYQNMIHWHNCTYRFKGCEGCEYIEICQTGCRMSAYAYYGSLDKQDNLMCTKNNFSKRYSLILDKYIYKKIDKDIKFFVPKRIRFRKEKGFYLVNIRWANTITVTNEIAEFLMRYWNTGDEFSADDFGRDKIVTLSQLFSKDVLESRLLKGSDFSTKVGLSIDPSLLPAGR